MGFARKSMKALWDGLCKVADTNHDEMISLDEWVTLLKGVDPKNEPKWFNEYQTFMFKLFDVSSTLLFITIYVASATHACTCYALRFTLRSSASYVLFFLFFELHLQPTAKWI